MTEIAPFPIRICGIDELSDHGEAGVSHVLSILDPEWPVPEAFGQYSEHARLELRFHDIITDQPDMFAPRRDHLEQFLTFARDMAREGGAHLLVHCHAGVSRSTAAMALILAQTLPDHRADAILSEVVRIRPQAWPNLRILEMGDVLLGRQGTLVAAAAPVYRAQIARQPHLAEQFRAYGRGREVTLALG